MKRGFTLAEVLITLMILGVIVMITLPTLIPKVQDKLYARSASIFNRRLGEALKVMNLHDTLSGYSNTEDFVKELGKNLKIDKTCSVGSMDKCFVSEFNVGTENWKTSDIKNSKHLNKSADYGKTEVVGVRFTNGVSALIAYNKNAQSDQYNNDFIKITGDGTDIRSSNVGIETDALTILYDTNGLDGPNLMGKDIVGLNIELVKTCSGKSGRVFTYNGETFCDLGTNYEAYGTYVYDGIQPDYWAGAQKACAAIGGTSVSGDFLWEPRNGGQGHGCNMYRAGLLRADGYWTSWSYNVWGAWPVWKVSCSNNWSFRNQKLAALCKGDFD